MSSRPPTPRQRECFERFAKLGDQQQAAEELGLSIGCLKKNISEYYRRIGANCGVQAAYLTWRPRDAAE
jgi:DNA-binding NarL/FixJ family response regulator